MMSYVEEDMQIFDELMTSFWWSALILARWALLSASAHEQHNFLEFHFVTIALSQERHPHWCQSVIYTAMTADQWRRLRINHA